MKYNLENPEGQIRRLTGGNRNLIYLTMGLALPLPAISLRVSGEGAAASLMNFLPHAADAVFYIILSSSVITVSCGIISYCRKSNGRTENNYNPARESGAESASVYDRQSRDPMTSWIRREILPTVWYGKSRSGRPAELYAFGTGGGGMAPWFAWTNGFQLMSIGFHGPGPVPSGATEQICRNRCW